MSEQAQERRNGVNYKPNERNQRYEGTNRVSDHYCHGKKQSLALRMLICHWAGLSGHSAHLMSVAVEFSHLFMYSY